MRAIVQRVTSATVTINGTTKRSIENGLVVLLGISISDTPLDAEWLCGKICRMRIFSDDAGLMNRSVTEIEGSILLISQFTLHASVKKGNRPSFLEAARPEIAIPLYEECIRLLNNLLPDHIYTGEFGADMKINLVNDGPVTIFIDTKNPE